VTRDRSPRIWGDWVDPRVCGGYASHRPPQILVSRQIPAHAGETTTIDFFGLIPARAGETPPDQIGAGCRAVDPRSRGGDCSRSSLVVSTMAVDPRSRGGDFLPRAPCDAYQGRSPLARGRLCASRAINLQFSGYSFNQKFHLLES
jgi:hypothetical protein